MKPEYQLKSPAGPYYFRLVFAIAKCEYCRRLADLFVPLPEKGLEMNQEQLDIRAGQPLDYPGCWTVTGTNAEGRSWVYFRKEDGTFWEVLKEDFFPRSGGTLRFELGNQVTDAKILATLRGFYREWQQTKFRVEVFDCPERGFRNFADRESANQYRDSLVSTGVNEANIRIVAINS